MTINDNTSDTQKDISFCLPVFNVKEYIEACIKSIDSQTMNNISYEILCIDDCSTDGSYELLQTISKNNRAVKLVKNKENKGVSYTRNQLIEQASGTYIWFVDPDDMLYPNCVNKIYNIALRYNPDVILADYMRIEDNDTEEYIKNISENEYEHVSFGMKWPIDTNNRRMSAVWCGMFKRQFLVTNKLKFNEDMIAQEDTLFYYEFLLKTKNVIKCEAPCYLYRQRATSVMHTRTVERAKKYYTSMLAMLKTYEQHLMKKDYTDIDILTEKIHHSRQNVATTLCGVCDTKYVYEQLKFLKREKIYPYPFRKNVFLGNRSILYKWLIFLTPIQVCFWIQHFSYKIMYYKNKNR